MVGVRTRGRDDATDNDGGEVPEALTWDALISAAVGGLIASGVLGALLWGGFKAKLTTELSSVFVKRDTLVKDLLAEEVFAKRSEVNEFGGRVTGAISVATMAKDTADSNTNSIIRLQEAQRYWQQFADTLTKIDARLNDHEKAITKATTVLESLADRMDRHEDRLRD